MTRKDNPSDRFEDDFDEVYISNGMWMFARHRSAPTDGAAQTFGRWSVDAHTAEVEEHGGIWRTIDPRTM